RHPGGRPRSGARPPHRAAMVDHVRTRQRVGATRVDPRQPVVKHRHAPLSDRRHSRLASRALNRVRLTMPQPDQHLSQFTCPTQSREDQAQSFPEGPNMSTTTALRTALIAIAAVAGLWCAVIGLGYAVLGPGGADDDHPDVMFDLSRTGEQIVFSSTDADLY